MADRQAYLAGERPGAPLQHLTHWDENLHFQLVEAPRTEILPGITLVRFPQGHAYGVLAVVLSGSSGNMIVASDLAYTERALEKNPPTLVTDTEGYLKGIDLLKDALGDGVKDCHVVPPLPRRKALRSPDSFLGR